MGGFGFYRLATGKFLVQGLRVLLVGEHQTNHTRVTGKRIKERLVLVQLEPLVYLVRPYHASTAKDVYQLHKVRRFRGVFNECEGAL